MIIIKFVLHHIHPDVCLEDLLSKAREQIASKGYFIAKQLLAPASYNISREQSISYIQELEKKKRNLEEPLRGYVSAGMENILGQCNNKSWYLYRACLFNWNRQDPKLKTVIEISKELSKIRNQIANQPLDYGEYIELNNDICYTSLSYYPPNGGFIKPHRDSLMRSMMHFKVELTHKGQDYESGGFFVRSKDNHIIDLSELVKPMDVIFFDGFLEHKISPIIGKGIGRIAFFEIPTTVTLSSRTCLYQNDGWSRVKRKMLQLHINTSCSSTKLMKSFMKLIH